MDVVSKLVLVVFFFFYFKRKLLYFLISNLQIWLSHQLKVQVTVSTKLISATGQEPQTPFQPISPQAKLFGKDTKPVFLDLMGMVPLP